MSEQQSGSADWEPDPEITELIGGEKPDWTDPTACPYPDCDKRGGELQLEYHLSQEHGWFLIETNFESETVVDDRDIDSGEQATLCDIQPGTDQSEGQE